MFCPKCGYEALENQRFCKSCGTNLKLIYGALESEGSDKGPFGIDVESLAKQAKEFAESWKSGWGGAGMVISHTSHRDTNPVVKKKERKEPPLPKPKEWLPYSWQHNLKYGLISLFSGAGLGVFLYYIGRTAIDAGTIRSIEEAAGRSINGLEQILMLLWLVALIPVLKGLAQIIYAAFFADSIATLSDRFVPPVVQRDTAPQSQENISPPFRSALEEPPPSVTEHTTHIFEKTQSTAKQEKQ